MTPVDTSYCPGCTHGVAHRIIMETLEEKGMLGQTIGVSPIGCSVQAHKFMIVVLANPRTAARRPWGFFPRQRVHPTARLQIRASVTCLGSARLKSTTRRCAAKGSARFS
jgi:2-oxoglutarate ferredoxin oxidoreductase subunit beta